MSQTLNELVHVAPRFRRSIHLEADVGSPAALSGYVVSPLARDVTFRVLQSLRPDAANRAWALVGPYGSGKSSFATFLSLLLDPGAEAGQSSARDLFQVQWPEHTARLDSAVSEAGKRILAVPITGERMSLGPAILRGLLKAGTRFWTGRGTNPVILSQLEEALHQPDLPGSQVVDLTAAFARKVGESAKPHQGVCIIIDEFGKLLEWAAQHPDAADIYLLQQLAEAAARQSKGRFAIITVVHQSFDAYAEGLPRSVKDEWIKVEGRFELIPYLEPPAHLLQLVGRALELDESVRELPLYTHIASLVEQLTAGTNSGDELSATELARCFPLNPVTAMCLGPVFRLGLGQNERSLFAFLSASEPLGFQDYLRGVDGSAGIAAYGLHHLYDYLVQNTSVLSASNAHSRTWSATAQAVSRLPAEATSIHDSALKAICVLSVLASTVGLRPDVTTVATAIGSTVAETDIALGELETWSAIVFRKYKRAFQIWDGSDINVSELVGRFRSEILARGNFAALLQKQLPPTSVVASRHYYQSGTLRFLRARFTASTADSMDDGVGDGTLWLLLPDLRRSLELTPLCSSELTP